MTTQNTDSNTSSVRQKKVKVTCAYLVRLNLNAHLRDLAANEQIWSEFYMQHKAWLKSDRNDEYPYSEDELLRLQNFTDGNFQTWSMARLAERLYTVEMKEGKKSLVGRVRRILSRDKGGDEINLEEVIRLAVEVNVSPGSLLNPLRTWLEEDTLLEFINFGPEPLVISALKWYQFVNGLSGIHESNKGHRLQMMNFSAEDGLYADASRPYFTQAERERILDARKSPILPPRAEFDWSTVEYPAGINKSEVPSPHPLDLMKAPASYLARTQAQARASINLLNILRHAFMVGNSTWVMEDRKEDIEAYLDQLRVVLSELSISAAPIAPRKLPKSKYVGPKKNEEEKPQ